MQATDSSSVYHLYKPQGIATIIIPRLTQEMYVELERKLQAPIVGDKTTDLQAGFQLGIQHVLRLIRQDYVIGS